VRSRRLHWLSLLAALLLAGCGTPVETADKPAAKPAAKQGEDVDLDPALVARERKKVKAPARAPGSRAQVVNAVPPGQASEEETLKPSKGSESARGQTDASIRRDLKLFQSYLSTIPPATGKVAKVISSGEAMAPFDAPPVIADVIGAANQIARTPYRWGGGHSAWRDKGYDCSGSVSFALAAAGLVDSPLTSGLFMRWGAAGPGKWITVYANAGHAWMTVAGLRFDTSGLKAGTRWQKASRSTAGFVMRHPPGL
jgi:cell wall-associated NlpC family hydrolase